MVQFSETVTVDAAVPDVAGPTAVAYSRLIRRYVRMEAEGLRREVEWRAQ